MYQQSKMMQTFKPSRSLSNTQRKKDINELAQTTKDQIHETIQQYKNMLDNKEKQLIGQVDNTLLNLLERCSGIVGMESKIEYKMEFAIIHSKIKELFEQNEAQKTQHNALIQKIENKLEEAILNQQRVKQKLQELKRKYRNKNKSTAPPVLPLPNASIISTRYRRQNQMLIQQNLTLSSQLISLQSVSNCHQSAKCLSSNKQMQLQTKIEQLQHLLMQSNNRLLSTQSQIFQKARLIQLQTTRTHYETQKQLSSTINTLKQHTRNLQSKIQELTLQIQQLARSNKQLESEQSNLIRKQILQDVMNQLNNQLLVNENIKSQYQQLKTRYITKQNQYRNKQMQYINKIQQTTKANDLKYQQLKQQYISKIQSLQRQSDNKLIQLRKQTSLSSETIRNKQEQNTLLSSELEVLKDQLKQTKRIKKQSKKNVAQKQLIQQKYNSQINSLNQQISKFKTQFLVLKSTYDNKIKLLEIKFKIMKQKYQVDIVQKLDKGNTNNKVKKLQAIQIGEILIESFSNYVHKEALINKLNKQLNELKSTKKVNSNKQHVTQSQNIITMNSIISQQRICVQKSICIDKIHISEQKLSKCQISCQALQSKIVQLQSQLACSESKIKQLQKSLKQKCNTPPVPKIQIKQISNNNQHQLMKQQIQNWKQKYNQLRKQRDDKQMELKLKKQNIGSLKSVINKHQNTIGGLNTNNEELREEIQKSKKIIKQYQRKQQVYKQNKQKLESIKQLERENEELKKDIEDKLKGFKAEITKKDAIIKSMKQKQKEKQTERYKEQSQLKQQQILALEQQLKKIKMQLQRKDSLCKVYKDKIEKSEQHYSKQQRNLQQKYNKQRAQLIRQTKKGQTLKFQNKKAQSEIFSLKAVLRKVHDNFSKLLQTKKRQPKNALVNFQIYSQAFSILNIAPQDASSFIPQQQQQYEDATSDMKHVMSKVKELLPMIKERILN